MIAHMRLCCGSAMYERSDACEQNLPSILGSQEQHRISMPHSAGKCLIAKLSFLLSA